MKQRFFTSFFRLLSLAISLLFIFFTQYTAYAQLMPEADKTNFANSGGFYSVLKDGSPCASTDTGVTLTGGDNPTKIWNFFRSKGLDDMHTAAVLGNLQQESGFNPEIVESNPNHPELPRTTADPASLPAVSGWPGDPSTVRQPGWGLVQWTPSGKIVGIASGYGVTSPINGLPAQLAVIWDEMTTGPTPSSESNFLSGFQQTTNLSDATNYFSYHYERAGINGPRLSFATDLLSRYGGSTSSSTTTASTSSTTTPSSGGCLSSANLSPNCTTATGSAKILCAAKAYDAASYQESYIGGHQGGAAWHASCPTINSSCYVDCSGLVNMAVYDAFGVDLKETTYSEVSDTSNWKQVSYKDVQPGDLIQPNPGHVEIIDHVNGSSISTFGAHNGNVPQPDQVGASDFYQDAPGNVYLHYIGAGSS